MAFWSKKPVVAPPAAATAAAAAAADDTGMADHGAAGPGVADAATVAAAPAPPPAPPPPTSALARFNTALAPAGPASTDTSALNPKIVQAVQLSNSETAGYAASQIAVPPNMMITQAAGLVAQSAANYFDGVSKLVLATQGVMLKQLTENLVEQKLPQAAEDALGIVATDVLLGMAAVVAAAAGALEAEAAGFAIDRIDQSITKYGAMLSSRSAPS